MHIVFQYNFHYKTRLYMDLALGLAANVECCTCIRLENLQSVIVYRNLPMWLVVTLNYVNINSFNTYSSVQYHSNIITEHDLICNYVLKVYV